MELVGRGGELSSLRLAMDRASAGRRTVAVVKGEAGIGKTSLLTALRTEATTRDAVVLSASLTQVESSMGWAGLATLLNGTERTIVGLSAPQREALLSATGRGVNRQIEPLSIAAALAELLRLHSRTGMTVVIVDDVQWLDAATAAALSFAIRLHPEVPILYVLAARAERIPLDVGRLVDPASSDDLVMVEPGRLSVAAIFELLDHRFGLRLGRVDLVRLHELTGGNPLHVIETGRLLAAGWPLADALMPASLSGIVDLQLERLDRAHLPVLQAAALMPSIDPELLCRLHPNELVDAALADAETIDLVRASAGSLSFRHPLIQAGLARSLSTIQRRAMHHRLASLSDEPDVAALHLSESAQGSDEGAAELLESAARRARLRGLPVQAANTALRAYELTDVTKADLRSRRRLLAAESAYDSGDHHRTLDLLLPVVDDDSVEPDHRLAALRLIAFAEGRITRNTTSIAWIERLVRESQSDDEQHTRARVMLSRALLFHDMPAAALAADDALDTARAGGSAEQIEDALAAGNVARFLCGQPVDIDRDDGVRASLTSPAVHSASSMLGEMLVWSDRLDEASTVLADELRLHETNGSVSGILESTSQLIDVRLRAGDLAAAQVSAQFARNLASTAGWKVSAVLRSAELALITALRGEPHETFVDTTRVDLDLLSTIEVAQLSATLGHTSLVTSDFTAAAEQLRTAHAAALAVGLSDLGALPYHSNLVEVLVTIGALDEANAVVNTMAVTAARSRRGRADAEVFRARAMVLSSLGDLDRADVAATDAVRVFEDLPLPLERGRALLLAGSIARRRKQRARAGQLLRAAEALFVDTGAIAYSRRVATELDRLGAPTRNELTATEAQIAELVAAGRRNDEIAAELFIARRTVESNLTRVYRKLGVRSRTELAARLRAG